VGDLSPGIKQLGHEADHTLPSGAEVKNACSYASMPPCLHVSMPTQAYIV